MTEESPIPELPEKAGTSVRFNGGRSGREAVVTKLEDGLFAVHLSDDHSYAAALRQDAYDSFTLTPVGGVHAIGGTGLSWTDVVGNF